MRIGGKLLKALQHSGDKKLEGLFVDQIRKKKDREEEARKNSK
jgi:hypothetical protein